MRLMGKHWRIHLWVLLLLTFSSRLQAAEQSIPVPPPPSIPKEKPNKPTEPKIEKPEVDFARRLRDDQKEIGHQMRSSIFAFINRLEAAKRERDSWFDSEAKEITGKNIPYSKQDLQDYLNHEYIFRARIESKFRRKLVDIYDEFIREVDSNRKSKLSRQNESVRNGGDAYIGFADLSYSRWHGKKLMEEINNDWDKELEDRKKRYLSISTLTSTEKKLKNPLDEYPGTVQMQLYIDNEPISDAKLKQSLADCIAGIAIGVPCPMVAANDAGELFYYSKKVSIFYFAVQPNGSSAGVDAQWSEWLSGKMRDRIQAVQITAQERTQFDRLVKAERKRLPDRENDFPVATPPPSPIYGDPSKLQGPLIITNLGVDIRNVGLHLIDWDGFLANPAIKFVLRAAPSARLPMTIKLKANHPRLAFDTPSSVGPNGPEKVKYLKVGKRIPIVINHYDEEIPFHLTVWPDRDGNNESYALTVETIETKPQPPQEKNSDPKQAGGVLAFFNISQSKESAAEVKGDPPLSRTWSYPISVEDQDLPEPDELQPDLVTPDPYPAVGYSVESAPHREGFPFVGGNAKAMHPWPFTITLDFQDKSGFFQSPQTRAVVRRAANDWAYFFADQEWDPVGEFEEKTEIIDRYLDPKADEPNSKLTNQLPFKDFMLYVTGFNTRPPMGKGNAFGSGYQQHYGISSGIRRSGQLLIEGVETHPGYKIDTNDDRWFDFIYDKSLPDEKRDLYSFAMHEIGHALFLHVDMASVGRWQKDEEIRDLYVLDYQGHYPKLDPALGHLVETNNDKEVIFEEHDAASLRGAFGAVKGRMPHRRWLITKLDLLIAQAAGYKLRPTSAFLPLEIEDRRILSLATVGETYSDRVVVKGGVPWYRWELAPKPPGLDIHVLTGEISGTPTEEGEYTTFVRVSDQMGDEVTQAVRIVVRKQ